ncbi:MAG: hypothetical protein K2L95_04405 [Alphaproteobacteria bacterium]|nr:hypothetical protein [Alphaproteobacteria bacterium]
MKKGQKLPVDAWLCIVIMSVIAAGGVTAVCRVARGPEREKGTVVVRENYQLFVDINGDNRVDRILNIEHRGQDEFFYNYAQTGDTVEFYNPHLRNVVYRTRLSPVVRTLNGRDYPAMKSYVDMAKKCRDAGLQHTR